MIQRPQPYNKQIHVCINNRNGESPSCGYSGSWSMKVTKTDVPQIVDTYLKLEEGDQAKEVAAAAK